MSDPDTQGPDDAGTTGPDLAAADTLRTRAESVQTVTNDAVAGETVEPGLGDANQGPTGGSPREAEPILPDNELAGQDVDLDDER